MTSLLLAALLALTADPSTPAGPATSPAPAPSVDAPSAEAPPLPAPAQPEPPPEPPQPPPAEAPPAPAAPADATWYDEGHAFVTESLLWSVNRLDRFFGDERQVDLPRNDSFLRWRNDLKFTDAGAVSFSTGARAELRIPSLDRRLAALRLTIAGGTTDALDRLVSGDSPAPDAATQPSAGLKLFLLHRLLTQADVQAGLLFQLPLGWYTRLVFRHVHPIPDVLVARMALSGFWQTPTGWGTRQDLDLERQLAPWLLLRLANTATITEVSRGYEWASELGLFAAVGQRTGLFLGGAASGATDVGLAVEIWKVHARARRDVLRRWLFLELEPGVQWKRLPGGGPRERERSIILRLEVQFGGGARLAPPAPAPAPAPGPLPTPPPTPASAG